MLFLLLPLPHFTADCHFGKELREPELLSTGYLLPCYQLKQSVLVQVLSLSSYELTFDYVSKSTNYYELLVSEYGTKKENLQLINKQKSGWMNEKSVQVSSLNQTYLIYSNCRLVTKKSWSFLRHHSHMDPSLINFRGLKNTS